MKLQIPFLLFFSFGGFKDRYLLPQEAHHYITSTFSDLETVQARDKLKLALTREKGITLFPIPRWWNGTKQRYLTTES